MYPILKGLDRNIETNQAYERFCMVKTGFLRPLYLSLASAKHLTLLPCIIFHLDHSALCAQTIHDRRESYYFEFGIALLTNCKL